MLSKKNIHGKRVKTARVRIQPSLAKRHYTSIYTRRRVFSRVATKLQRLVTAKISYSIKSRLVTTLISCCIKQRLVTLTTRTSYNIITKVSYTIITKVSYNIITEVSYNIITKVSYNISYLAEE